MELTLQFKEIHCCETTEKVVLTHEETLETVIPEYCPDIARIVDTAGQLRVREKKLSGGRLMVTGTVRVNVLYTSGERSGLRSVAVSVPFTCSVEDPRLIGCRTVCVCGRLPLVDARAVNARKLYVRVMPEFEVEGVADPQRKLCSGVDSDVDVQVREEQLSEKVLTAVLEREFTWSQEFDAGKQGRIPEEILLDRVNLRATECQRIGPKLVVKGEADVSLLYRSQEQELCSTETLLPFSQIVDAADFPEDTEFQAELGVIDSDIRLLRGETGPEFGITVRMVTGIKAYCLLSLSYIKDMYSTAYEMDTAYQDILLPVCTPPEVVQSEAVQQLEFGQGEPFACLTGVENSGAATVSEGNGTTVKTNLRLKILYLDETGAPMVTERVMEVEAHTLDIPRSVRVICRPPEMKMLPGSCQVKIPVDFFCDRRRSRKVETIREATPGAAVSREMPSLILRRIAGREDLWNVAKQYHTKETLIRSVNDLEEGSPLPEGMLLIPRERG